MRTIKTIEEWISQSEISENLKIAIKLEDDSDEVLQTLKSMHDVKDINPLDCGIINASASKERVEEIKKLLGVEDVEITK